MQARRRCAAWRLVAVSLFLFASLVRAEQDPEIVPAQLADAMAEYAVANQSGDMDRLLSAAHQVVTIAEKTLAEDDERLPEILANYGKAQLQVGQSDEAKETLGRALKLAEQVFGRNSPELLDILPALADASSDRYHKSIQLSVYRRALKVAAKNYGKSSETYATLAQRAAINSYRFSQNLKGRRFLEHALAYLEEQHGVESYETAEALFYLGKLERANRRHYAAIRYLLSAVRAFEQSQSDRAADMQLLTHALLARSYSSTEQHDLETQQYVEIGRLSEARPSEDLQPLLRYPPVYPTAMLIERNEGYVDLEYTVDQRGFTRNIVVVDRGTYDAGFDQAAIDAVKRFRYAPRFVNGEPVVIDGVKIRVSFELE